MFAPSDSVKKIVQVTAVKPFGSLWTFHRAGPDKDSELFAKHHFYLATTRNCTPKVSASSVECVPSDHESAQLKTVLESYEMEIHQINAHLSEIENEGEKKYRSETPITKL